MSDFVQTNVEIGLIMMIVLLLIASYRVWKGPSPADRLQAIDISTTLLVGIMVVLGLALEDALLIDVGIALAAFSFVATVAIARYLSEGRVF